MSQTADLGYFQFSYSDPPAPTFAIGQRVSVLPDWSDTPVMGTLHLPIGTPEGQAFGADGMYAVDFDDRARFWEYFFAAELTVIPEDPEIPATVLSAAARLHATDVYAVGKDTWQVERYGRASTLKRELEALGFTVTSATDDRMDDQRYSYAMFRE